MKLESTTYNYAMSPKAGEWPDLKKTYSKTMVYRPDYLSFDIHVTTETRRVSAQNIRVSGFRILKDGTPSTHRCLDSFYSSDHALPTFVAEHVKQTLAKHGA